MPKCVIYCIYLTVTLLVNTLGRNVHTEQIRYGLRVAVIGLPSHPMMASPAELKVVGPNAFGFGGIIARKNIFQFLSKLFDSK